MLPDPPRERLTLPGLPTVTSRSGFPIVATLAPVVVSLVLWMLTQSIYSLLFAFLGPVVALGSLIDGRFSRRREARRERERFRGALDRTASAVAAAHERTRVRLTRVSRDPTATVEWTASAATATEGPSIQGQPVPVRVGQGTIDGRIDLGGEDPIGDEPEELAALRAYAARLRDAPIVVDARDGIGVIGPPVLATAVARALALRLAATLSPSSYALTAPADETWAEHLPHRVRVGDPGRYLWTTGEDPIAAISWAQRAVDLPLGCGVKLAIGEDCAIAGLGIEEGISDARVDARTSMETVELVRGWRARAAELGLRSSMRELPRLVRLTELLERDRHPSQDSRAASRSLAAPVGRDAEGLVEIDLVTQGPHAVIAGTTGSGKSELLIAWILAMASGRSPDEVTFLLVDFKGGSSFTPLAKLPHVLATLSDLDARLTRRAIESLRAEILSRERVLAAASVRSIDELPAGALARLVIVVDEFAAVVASSPELHDVFGDLAARGRSLGLHLVLCTQRPAGVIRDAVLANATLRVSLRVTDRGDSVAILGDGAAALLPAEPRGRGILLGSGGPQEVQFAITAPGDATRIIAGSAKTTRSRPWCDPLQNEIELYGLPQSDAGLSFGLLDLPAEQRQPPAIYNRDRHGHLLVLGGAGAGSTTALQTLAVSAARQGIPVHLIPSTAADAWQSLHRVCSEPGDRPLVFIDDLDSLVASFDTDYRHEIVELLTSVARGTANSRPTLVVAARRLTGSLNGIAGLFGSRLLLRQTSRDEHILAGGEPRQFDLDLPPGAGTWRGDVVQVAQATVADRRDVWTSAPCEPRSIVLADHPVIGLVASRPRVIRERLIAAGARVVDLVGGSVSPDELQVAAESNPTVVLGDPDAWLADWALLAKARRDWPIVLIGATPTDHRGLLRDRTLPPPLGALEGECWLSVDGCTERAMLSLP